MNDNLHDIIECCYSAIDDSANLGVATEMIGKAINADAGDIVSEFIIERTTQTHGSFGFDPVFLEQYDSAYLGKNPWLTNLLRLPMQQVHSDEMFSSDYKQSSYCNEWVRPQGLCKTIGSIIEHTPNVMHTWVGFVRETGCRQFGTEECKLVAKVLPHLRRTLVAIQSLRNNSTNNVTLQAMCETLNSPVFLLNAQGRLVFENHLAENLLSQHQGLFLKPNGQLSARHARTNELLGACISSAASLLSNIKQPLPDTISVEISSEKIIALTIVPLRTNTSSDSSSARVAVFASGADITKDTDINPVAELYGLTSTEADLTLSIFKGYSLRQYADANGTSVSTARWHLKNVESKTGTTRIGELMSLVQSTIVPIRTR